VTTVIDRFERRPQTHVLAIGVGSYRHLSSGEIPELANLLGRLTSPPRSAVAFADWIAAELNNPHAPLGSLELLLSPKQQYRLPGGDAVPVDEATSEAVKPAFDRWLERCNGDPGNVAMLFFSGHGIEYGDLHLLLDDVGASRFRLLENTINLTQTYGGLKQCQAMAQCFFVDACREISAELIEWRGASQGLLDVPLVYGNFARDAPIYFSTFESAQAFGDHERPSVYTELLLRAFATPTTLRGDETWAVTTSGLQEAIVQLFHRPRPGAPLPPDGQQPRLGGHTAGPTVLHVLDHSPSVQVSVACRPQAVTPRARLALTACDGTDLSWQRQPQPDTPEPWHVEVPVGSYDVRADFLLDRLPSAEKRAIVWPPARDIELPVDLQLEHLTPTALP
jgi:hypothetical protein